MKNPEIIAIYDNVKGFEAEYFDKFNITLLSFDEFRSNFKTVWTGMKMLVDGTMQKSIYKKMAMGQKESVFYRGCNSVTVSNQKIISVPDFRNYIRCNNAENFDVASRNKFGTEMEILENVLELISNKSSSFTDKEIEELFSGDNKMNITDIVPNSGDEEYIFVKDKTDGLMPDANVIDVNSFMLLKELKEIFLHKI